MRSRERFRIYGLGFSQGLGLGVECRVRSERAGERAVCTERGSEGARAEGCRSEMKNLCFERNSMVLFFFLFSEKNKKRL